MFRSALLVFLGVAVTGFMAVATLFFSPLCRRRAHSIHRVANLWARIILFLSGVKARVYGLENIASDGPQIYMANHQSDFDIFIILTYIPGQFRWIAKKELYRIPVFGAAMKRAGYIPIDRFNRERAIASLNEAAETVRQGTSLMTFPEGTRSRDGTIKPFKKGLFYLALQAGVPIVPITIIGSGSIMPKRSLRVRPGEIVLVVDTPIDVADYSLDTREKLIATVRNRIIDNFYDDRYQPAGKDNH